MRHLIMYRVGVSITRLLTLISYCSLTNDVEILIFAEWHLWTLFLLPVTKSYKESSILIILIKKHAF